VDEVHVYPNPYRISQAVGGTLKFTGLSSGDKVKLFTITGEKVVENSGVTGRWEWDGRNTSGDKVVSGVYIWIIDRENGEKYTGKLFIVR
jgi:flagellar hook assembly protein FlgD